MCLHICTGEVISILVRRKNGGLLTNAVFTQAMTNFRTEVLDDANFKLAPATYSLVSDSHEFIEQYSLNATDALILQAALVFASMLRRAGDDLVLVTSDQRLLRAAQAEALATFNPETDSQVQLEALL